MRNDSAVSPATGSPDEVSTVKYTATLEGRWTLASIRPSLSPPPQAADRARGTKARRIAPPYHLYVVEEPFQCLGGHRQVVALAAPGQRHRAGGHPCPHRHRDRVP